MVDLKYIKENYETVRENIRNRYMNVDIDDILALYEERNRLLRSLEEIRQKRNENAKRMKAKLEPEERSSLIEQGKQFKEQIASLEEEMKSIEVRL